MKVSFNKVITKKWKSHLEVWVAKRHIHGWLLAKPFQKSISFTLNIMNSDIWTNIWYNFCDNFFFSLFSLVKNNGERKMKRENKNIVWVWERKLSKSYYKRVVQISFSFFIDAASHIYYRTSAS